MHITRVELENVKSHKSANFTFERGTTAIMGMNGAGKTTIIEAIAWTLFDLLEYKKDDFASRGSKTKGIAKVYFESSLDEREYMVYRDTSTGYYVYDPRLKSRIADKKDEVAYFLRQHMGVEPGTDLEALFRRAIGVPQGTFTAIFLETAAERKKAFDKLLKVEEYRQGAEKLRETQKYIEDRINAVREKIARAEGELSRFETFETEEKELQTQIGELDKTRLDLKKQIEDKNKAVSDLEAIEKQLNELSTEGQRLKHELDSANQQRTRIEADFNRAKEAAEKLKSLEHDNKLHLASIAELSKLEGQRIERDKIQVEVNANESKIVSSTAEKKALDDAFKKALEAKEALVIWLPKVKEQEELEKQREALIKQAAGAREVENQIASLEEKLKRLRVSHQDNMKRISEAEEKSKAAGELAGVQLRDAEITRMLAKKRASLERDEQFQREIKNGLCPILSQKCLNLKEGQTLEDFVGSQFEDYKKEIVTLEAEQKEISAKLSDARAAEKFAAVLNDLQKRKEEITEEGTRLREEQEGLKKSLENLPEIQKEIAALESKINLLENPKAKVLAFEREATAETAIKDKLIEIDHALKAFEEEKISLSAKFSAFSEMEILLKKFQAERDQTINAHREYIANEALANSAAGFERELSEIGKSIEKLEKEVKAKDSEIAKIQSGFDVEKFKNERAALIGLQTQEADATARFDIAKQRLENLHKEIEHLKSVREQMKTEFQEKERLEKTREATQFIRDTLKEAAPHVARNYVYHISNEANQMFREITGNPERTLKWTDDYGIMLEEGGYERPFQNLSGGEQMAAALAVRLALLKQLSDIRLAFFDEPTTNMDLERRTRLAEQISQIRHFDQLFVISHDDTFEEFVDHVVTIQGRSSMAEAQGASK